MVGYLYMLPKIMIRHAGTWCNDQIEALRRGEFVDSVNGTHASSPPGPYHFTVRRTSSACAGEPFRSVPAWFRRMPEP